MFGIRFRLSRHLIANVLWSFAGWCYWISYTGIWHILKSTARWTRWLSLRWMHSRWNGIHLRRWWCKSALSLKHIQNTKSIITSKIHRHKHNIMNFTWILQSTIKKLTGKFCTGPEYGRIGVPGGGWGIGCWYLACCGLWGGPATPPDCWNRCDITFSQCTRRKNTNYSVARQSIQFIAIEHEFYFKNDAKFNRISRQFHQKCMANAKLKVTPYTNTNCLFVWYWNDI